MTRGWTESQTATLRRMAAVGYGWTEIAAVLRKHVRTVCAAGQRLGIKVRDRRAAVARRNLRKCARSAYRA